MGQSTSSTRRGDYSEPTSLAAGSAPPTASPLIFVAAGEVSGDVHGANLVRAIRDLAPAARFVGWGSHRMADAGVEVVQDLVPYAAVGLTENMAAVRPASRALESARAFLAEQRPDLVVLIDYQGANMVLARHARNLGIPTVYYITPQEWIWGFKSGPARVARQVDTLLCVFEREAHVYRSAGAHVHYVGHPLLDLAPDAGRLQAVRDRLGLSADTAVLTVLPGSRRAEIDRLLAPMAGAVARVRRQLPDLRVFLPLASAHFRRHIESGLAAAGAHGIQVVEDVSGFDLIGVSMAVLAASGTVTLEAAVAGTPVVATYRVSRLTELLARKVFRVGHVTLPNILAGREVIPELLQRDANPESLASALLPLLRPGPARDQAVAALRDVRALLGEPGATRRAAEKVLELAARRS